MILTQTHIDNYGIKQVSEKAQALISSGCLLHKIYDCYVVEEEKDTVIIRLMDLEENSEDYDAEVKKHQFPANARFEPGSIFYWFFGSKEHTEFDLIEFSTAVWTQAMIDQAHQDANTLFEKLHRIPLSPEEHFERPEFKAQKNITYHVIKHENKNDN